MQKRRHTNADPDPPGLRSRLDAATEPVRAAAWALEQRLLWRGADRLRGAVEIVRWPFERLAWLLERRLIWPLQERAAERGVSGRAVGSGAIATVAVALAALGAVSLSGGDGGGEEPIAPTPVAAVTTPVAPPTAEPPAEPALRGTPPTFGLAAGESVDGAAASGGAASPEATIDADTPVAADEEAAATSSSQRPVPAGPAAMKVARRFAEAFVFYEIGERPERTAAVFEETTSPQLAAALEERPPRQPLGASVPQARVLNLVPGPRRGGAYTVSASLLRVGTTSELRLEMRRQNGVWLITDVRG
jgi:hypothetical protein